MKKKNKPSPTEGQTQAHLDNHSDAPPSPSTEQARTQADGSDSSARVSKPASPPDHEIRSESTESDSDRSAKTPDGKPRRHVEEKAAKNAPAGTDPEPKTPTAKTDPTVSVPPSPSAPAPTNESFTDSCTFTPQDDGEQEAAHRGEEDEPEPGEVPQPPAPKAPTPRRERTQSTKPKVAPKEHPADRIAEIAERILREKVLLDQDIAQEIARALAILFLDLGVPFTPAHFIRFLWINYGPEAIDALAEAFRPIKKRRK